MSLVCTRMSFVCHSYIFVCHSLSLVCTRMSLVSYSYVLVCLSYVTRMFYYHEPYFKSFLISFLSSCFYYTIMKFIMKVMLFRVLIYTFFETCVLLKNIFTIITRYFSYIFSICVVYLLYHIRLIRLSSDIELNPSPRSSSHADHPSGNRRGGVCIYHKESSPNEI